MAAVQLWNTTKLKMKNNRIWGSQLIFDSKYSNNSVLKREKFTSKKDYISIAGFRYNMVTVNRCHKDQNVSTTTNISEINDHGHYTQTTDTPHIHNQDTRHTHTGTRGEIHIRSEKKTKSWLAHHHKKKLSNFHWTEHFLTTTLF